MRLAITLLALCALSGCQSPHRLASRWAPLVEIVERPDLLVGGRVTTIGTRVYVANLAELLRRKPPGSVAFEALMLHEREHAIRQLRMGLGPWLARYLNDREFMWREEQHGWFQQLQHLQRFGESVRPLVIAVTLKDYRNLSGAMVGYAHALSWVEEVLAGTWKPDDGS